VRSIASNTIVAVTASALNRNGSTIEHHTALLSVKKKHARVQLHTNRAQARDSVGIGSSMLDRNRAAIDRTITD
jgi:hypothetical protein